MSEAKQWLPVAVDGASMRFGDVMKKLLPPMRDIPDKYEGRHVWTKWQNDWFFRGLGHYPVARDGIDRAAAMRHLATIQRSFEPKHEHKEAAVAWLASQWFTSPDGEEIKPASPPDSLGSQS
jgi:hypothetical protein